MSIATACYALAIGGGIVYFYLDYRIAKRRREREQRLIAWMNGHGPYPED